MSSIELMSKDDTEKILESIETNANNKCDERVSIEQQIADTYASRPYLNFSRHFDSEIYNSLEFDYENINHCNDYITSVNVNVINGSKFNFDVEEIKCLIALKFNNIFMNMCEVDKMFTVKSKYAGGVWSEILFRINFNVPFSKYYLKQFENMDTATMSINFVPITNVKSLKKFRYQECNIR